MGIFFFLILLPGRTWQASDYRYGFNGQEKDREVNSGASNFGMREYDERLGRFFSLDPKKQQYPMFSPYCFAANSPIAFTDENGEGPRYKVLAQAYINRWSEIKNNYKGIKGVDVQISKVEFTQIKQEIVVTVKVTMFGVTYDKTVKFNSKDSDSGHHSDLTGAGIDSYDAMIAESDNFSDRAYYRARQLDNHYEKPENGIPLMFKTWGVVLTGVVGAAELATANNWAKAFFISDVAFTANDLTVAGFGPNTTALDILGDKVGFKKEWRENAGQLYDMANFLQGLRSYIKDLANEKPFVTPMGAAFINGLNSEMNALSSLWNMVGGWHKTSGKQKESKQKGTYDNTRNMSKNTIFNRETFKD